MQTILDKI